MKLKLYYGAIALLWLLTGCTKGDIQNLGVAARDKYGTTYEHVRIEGHDYLSGYRSLSHDGNCSKCKQQLDSIVRAAVAEALEDTKEEWNE